MSSVDRKNSLPWIASKRVQTEGTVNHPHKYHRFSYELQAIKSAKRREQSEDRPNAYIKQWQWQSRSKQKMALLFYKNHLQRLGRKNHKNPFDEEIFGLGASRPAKAIVSKQKQLGEGEGQEQKQLIGQQERRKKMEQLRRQFTFNNVILSSVAQFYFKHIKDKQTTESEQSSFAMLLRENNPLLAKISSIITAALLKLGQIASYNTGETIYKQNTLIKNIGVILWGETVLKKSHTLHRINCQAGYGLGEQLIFESLASTSQKGVVIEKGEFLTLEGCKAVGNVGVLFIKGRQFSMLLEQLTKAGLKDAALRFKNLFQRTYLKKKEMRKNFS